VQVEATILVDAPRDDVFDMLTDYGGEVRRRLNPILRSQTVVARDGNEVLCDNEWTPNGKVLRQQRRYRLVPPEQIEEEVVGATQGLLRVVMRLDAVGDQTQLTMASTYRFAGIWSLLSRFARDRLRRDDEEFLAGLKARIEDEFEEVDEP
jgi:hypothetical protein